MNKKFLGTLILTFSILITTKFNPVWAMHHDLDAKDSSRVSRQTTKSDNARDMLSAPSGYRSGSVSAERRDDKDGQHVSRLSMVSSDVLLAKELSSRIYAGLGTFLATVTIIFTKEYVGQILGTTLLLILGDWATKRWDQRARTTTAAA